MCGGRRSPTASAYYTVASPSVSRHCKCKTGEPTREAPRGDWFSRGHTGSSNSGIYAETHVSQMRSVDKGDNSRILARCDIGATPGNSSGPFAVGVLTGMGSRSVGMETFVLLMVLSRGSEIVPAQVPMTDFEQCMNAGHLAETIAARLKDVKFSQFRHSGQTDP
jgi:hypothetical protein